MKRNLLGWLTLCLLVLCTAGHAVDVDLTAMSKTMVYAEVFNILGNPEAYLGKTIKMNGIYTVLYYGKINKHYHYVVVEDAAACCQQGFEFVRSGNYVYPKDYPKEKAKIEVTGVFKKGRDDIGYTYYYLAINDLKTL